MKKFPWFLSFELGARQACDRRHRTMGTVHSGKISHLTWTFTKKYWAVLGCTGLYWAVLGHLRYLLGNVQVKWRILPLCIGGKNLRVSNCTIAILLFQAGRVKLRVPHLEHIGWRGVACSTAVASPRPAAARRVLAVRNLQRPAPSATHLITRHVGHV